jgi:hypothetical protein
MIGAIVVSAVLCVGISGLLIAGWLRWFGDPNRANPLSDLSLIGFAIGITSVLLAIGSILYARSIGGFRHYDSPLLKIYYSGLSISAGGLIVGLLGRGRTGRLRNFAPYLSGVMILFWFLQAVSE